MKDESCGTTDSSTTPLEKNFSSLQNLLCKLKSISSDKDFIKNQYELLAAEFKCSTETMLSSLQQIQKAEKIRIQMETLLSNENNTQLCDLKEKLKTALNHAKHLENECSKLDHKLVESLKEKKQSDEVNQNLKRQIDSAKKEIQHFHIEAEKSIENPWETEEWEGLSACEVFDIIKHELVPAQQARLSKLCMTELENKLEKSSDLLHKVLSERDQLLEGKRKLEAKIFFIESSSESLSESSNTTIASKDRQVSESTNLQSPGIQDSVITSKHFTKQEEHKRLVLSSKKENNAEKRLKFKNTETDSPAKTVKVQKNLALTENPLEERDPLACVTNSPHKGSFKFNTSELLNGSKNSSARNSSLRQKALGERKKNPEECKQQ